MVTVAAPAIELRQLGRKFAWFGLLVAVCYAPVLAALVHYWYTDPDMGHAFFVPVISGYIVWQNRHELLAMKPRPSWWGVPLVLWGALQVLVGTLGVELFTERVAFVITVIGLVWTLCGF